MDQRKENNKGLLVVSFGTSYAAARARTLESVENTLRDAFPDRRFYRAWTSPMLRRKLQREEDIVIYSVDEALLQMEEDGVTDVLVQPTHMLAGEELQKTEETLAASAGRFASLAVGRPLLADEDDIASLAGILEEKYRTDDDELLVFMGHGSAAMSVPVYERMEERFRKDGYPNVCIGTVEYEPGIDNVLSRIRKVKPARVHLVPLLVTAGEHVLRDMAGDGPDSWKNQIAEEGCEPVCHLSGLGDLEEVRRIYTDHAERALETAAEVFG